LTTGLAQAVFTLMMNKDRKKTLNPLIKKKTHTGHLETHLGIKKVTSSKRSPGNTPGNTPGNQKSFLKEKLRYVTKKTHRKTLL